MSGTAIISTVPTVWLPTVSAGRTAAEAAALCGRPQKTVEAQIYRAKKMLAEQIRQERRSEDGIVS